MIEDEKIQAEIFLKMYFENCGQGRHHETQRSTVIGIILAVSVAMCGIATFDKRLSGMMDATIGIFLVFLGIFGAAFSLKHYERFNLHMERARQYRDALDRLLPNKPIKYLKEAADLKQKENFPLLYDLRLFYWWLALNFAISLLGASILAISVFWPII